MASQDNKFRYLVVLDFEATCDKDNNVSLSTQEIIEWPAMIIDTTTKKILQNKFHHYIKPKIHPKLTKFCIDLTKISQKTIDKSNNIINIVNEWNKYCLDNKLLIKTENKQLIPNACIITCGDWDLQKMWPIQQKLDKNIPNALLFRNWINIKTIFEKYYGKCQNGMIGMLDKLGIKHIGQHHSGIDDVQNICNIVIYMLNDKKKNIIWKYTSNNDKPFKDNWISNNNNRKPGDWYCNDCDYLNFASRDTCNICGISKPMETDDEDDGWGNKPINNNNNNRQKIRQGDWFCPDCNEMNFASRIVCRECGTKNPNPSKYTKNTNNINNQQRKPGDWDCKECNTLNFAFRQYCFECQQPKPFNNNNNNNNNNYKIPRKPGDWDCMKCKTLNFGHRNSCFGCGYSKFNKNINNNNNNNKQGYKNMKPGDWICNKCNEMNFAFRHSCFGCGANRQGNTGGGGGGGNRQQRKPGDWDCDKCNKMNFAFRDTCFGCGQNR